MEYKDYYQILGVNKNASIAEIKRVYRKLVRQYHPDINPGDQQAEERLKEINAAKAVLTDPDQRAHYDQLEGKSVTGLSRSNFSFDWGVWASGRAGACR